MNGVNPVPIPISSGSSFCRDGGKDSKEVKRGEKEKGGWEMELGKDGNGGRKMLNWKKKRETAMILDRFNLLPRAG